MRWLDSIINEMDMNLGKLQEMVGTGRPGVLQSMGLKRVRHNWAAEQQQEASETREKPRQNGIL